MASATVVYAAELKLKPKLERLLNNTIIKINFSNGLKPFDCDT